MLGTALKFLTDYYEFQTSFESHAHSVAEGSNS